MKQHTAFLLGLLIIGISYLLFIESLLPLYFLEKNTNPNITSLSLLTRNEIKHQLSERPYSVGSGSTFSGTLLKP